MARVLFTLDEPMFRADGRMAGLAVRTYEMARALARRGHEVLVAQPSPHPSSDGDLGFRQIRLADLESGGPYDVWICHPLLVRGCHRRLPRTPLVVDGYESPFGSFLAHASALVQGALARALPTVGDRARYWYRRTIVQFLDSLCRADHVLCANESQRISYLTLLCALGRIGPDAPGTEIVLTVPSGAPPELPTCSRVLPSPLERRGAEPVVLWPGGCYPWFDVATYLEAMPQIVRRLPDVRFVFAGTGGVDGRSARVPALALARTMRERVRELSVLDGRSTFVDWLPYADRGGLYAACDVGVCTYRDHLETTLSMRTRIIDMVWGGLPVVASAGDHMSRILETHGIGLTVAPGDPARLADAVVTLLSDPRRRHAMSRAARALAGADLSWDRQVEPLARYCEVTKRRAGGWEQELVRPAERIVQLNDKWSRRLLDAGTRLSWRMAGARALVRPGRRREILARLFVRLAAGPEDGRLGGRAARRSGETV